MELDKIIPKDGPNINEVEKYINKYQSEVIVCLLYTSDAADED